ncbi:hypothetical protein HDU86_002751 [Geranomyces michiganensis]|nr:hypothetical protein HDU86_002751 [Geranomyces michiganensis]
MITPADSSFSTSSASSAAANHHHNHNVSPPSAPAPACSAHFYAQQKQLQQQQQQQQHDCPPPCAAPQQQQQHCDASNPELAESLVFTASMIIESIWLTRTQPSHSPAAAAATCASAAAAATTKTPSPSFPNTPLSQASSLGQTPSPPPAPEAVSMSFVPHCGGGGAAAASPALAPLTRVIHELLRRSRTSCSTFQLSLFYLIKLRNALLLTQRSSSAPSDSDSFFSDSTFPSSSSSTPSSATVAPLRCGRRMFLAALILANKYLQDKNYSMKAWSKICGLDAAELCANERLFLRCVNYDLFVHDAQWAKWSATIQKRVEMVRVVRARKLREGEMRSREAMIRGWLKGVETPSMATSMAAAAAAANAVLAKHVAGAAAAAVAAPHCFGPASSMTTNTATVSLLKRPRPASTATLAMPKPSLLTADLDDMLLARSASPPLGVNLPPGALADVWAGLPSPLSSSSSSGRGRVEHPVAKRRRTVDV